MGVVIYVAIETEDAIIRMWYSVIMALGPVGMTSGITALTATETGRTFMVIAHGIQKWIDKKLREGEEKRAAKAEAKGRAEERKLWTEWNARREAAEARGEDFVEPPPNGKP